MVDIHCHILPEVDDGAWDMEAAVAMARIARDCGVKKIITTPHFKGEPGELEVLGLQNSRQRGSGRGPGERCRQVCSGVPALKPMVPLPSRPRVKRGSEGQQPSKDSALCIFRENLFIWLHRVWFTVQGIFCCGTDSSCPEACGVLVP